VDVLEVRAVAADDDQVEAFFVFYGELRDRSSVRAFDLEGE